MNEEGKKEEEEEEEEITYSRENRVLDKIGVLKTPQFAS